MFSQFKSDGRAPVSASAVCGEPARGVVLSILRQGPCDIAELVSRTFIPPDVVSQLIETLIKSGEVVESQREAWWSQYRVA
jgi:hypothetical protein